MYVCKVLFQYVPGDDNHLIGVIGCFQQLVEVSHHPIKRVAHQIQGPVRVDDGIFLVGTEICFRNDGIHQTFILVA